MLHRGHDFKLTPATVCGGTAEATAAATRLTPRLWLERRWQRTQSRSSHSRMAVSAAGMLEAPADQQQASQLTGTQQWEDLVLYSTEQHLKQQELIQGLHKIPVLVQQPHRQQQQRGHHPHQQQQHQRQALDDMVSDSNGQLLSSIPATPTPSDHQQQQHNITWSVKSSKAQLMQDITTSTSMHGLKHVYQASRSDMDVVHCSNMLNKLAHLHHAASGSRKNRQSTQAVASPVQQAAFELATLESMHSQQQQQPGQQQLQQQRACSSRLYRLDGRCRSRQVHRLLRALLQDFMQQLPAARTRQLSSTLWVIAKFSKESSSRKYTQQTAAALVDKLLGPTHAASTGHSHSRVSSSSSDGSAVSVCSVNQEVCRGHFADQLDAVAAPGGLQQSARRSIRHKLQQQQPWQCQPPMLLSSGSSTDVANTVWALGRLAQVFDLHQLLPAGEDLHNTISALEQLCCHHLHTQRPDGTFISSCLVGFAHMKQPVPRLFNALVARAGSNYITALQSQQVLALAWACAKLGHHDQQLFTRLLWRGVVVRRALLPQGVSLLLWAAGTLHHAAEPRAVSQLLQVWKQSGAGQASSRLAAVQGRHLANLLYGLMRLGQLQQQRSWVMRWLLPLVMQKLDDLQPMGIATVLTAVVQLTQEVPAAVSHPAGSHQKQLQQPAVVVKAAVHSQHEQSVSSTSCSRLTKPCRPAAASSRRLIGGLLSSGAADSHQLVSLYRELSRRIAAQLPHTKPSTLYTIITALHKAGYYDARLYTKLATAAAAAVGYSTDGLSSLEQQQTYMVPQLLQLVLVFARHHHPVPALWAAAVPQLVIAADKDQLQVQQQLLLLTAAVTSGCQQEPRAFEGLLHLASRVLQQQEALSVPQLVQAATAAGWVLRATRQGAGMHATTAALVSSLDWQVHRLVPRLVSSVLSQPKTLSVQYLPQLLEVAVLLEHRANCGAGLVHTATSASARLLDVLGANQLSLPSSTSSSSSSGASAAGEHCELKHRHSHHTVGIKQLQRLADVAVDHIGHWAPSGLIVLMSCHTQQPLFDAVLADAYAEELLVRIEQCSVQALVQLLQSLASITQGRQGYSHSQLLAVASRQLHSKLLLACDMQLEDAVEALQQLGQHHTAVYRAAVRLLEVWRR